MTTDPNIARVIGRRPEPPISTTAIRIEATITKLRDLYDALWDVMPAIAAALFLLWLILFAPRN